MLRTQLPDVAEYTVAAIIVEVPSYAGALSGEMGANIENAVQMALGGFLDLAARPRDSDPGTPLGPTLEGAYELGRGEARSGRTMDALLAAYRVGARVSWRELSRAAVAESLDADTLAGFAELVFAYIDEISAASVAGHSDELATTGRARQRHLERLGRGLLEGVSPEAAVVAAERAEWEPPQTLTAVVLSASRVRGVLSHLDFRTLRSEDDATERANGPGGPDSRPASDGRAGPERGLRGADRDAEEATVLLVPDAHGAGRTHLRRRLRGTGAVLGPAVGWTAARASYLRARRARDLGLHDDDGVVDTESHLPDLVLNADPAALADLRRQALAPLADLRPATAHKLCETLLAWLLHLGRRDQVAAALFVHPQTVRYRMSQLRTAYGDRLEDPDTVLALVLALAGRSA